MDRVGRINRDKNLIREDDAHNQMVIFDQQDGEGLLAQFWADEVAAAEPHGRGFIVWDEQHPYYLTARQLATAKRHVGLA